ncbi:MAG: hypothetical protein ACKOWE_03570, partial [Micrococcales bacterium]
MHRRQIKEQMAKINRLRVRTRAIDLPAEFQLTNHLSPNGAVFVRDGEGMLGSGIAVQLTATGNKRFETLASEFSAIAASAIIDDSVTGLGRGLIAFGSLTFSANSSANSTLIIPRVVLGLRDGRAWITQVWQDGEPEPAEVDSVETFEASHENYLSSNVIFEEGA